MIVLRSKQFVRDFQKLSLKIKDIFGERLRMFYANPYDPILNNHKLKGILQHYRSINITGDYRAIYEIYSENIVRFIRIWTHSEIYGN